MDDDPLDDRPKPHECDSGWVYVKEPYAEQTAKAKCNGDIEHPRYKVELAIARATVYPCRVCRPAEFFRWAGGHYNREHDTSRCDECSEGRRRRSTRRPMATTAPERRDIDT